MKLDPTLPAPELARQLIARVEWPADNAPWANHAVILAAQFIQIGRIARAEKFRLEEIAEMFEPRILRTCLSRLADAVVYATRLGDQKRMIELRQLENFATIEFPHLDWKTREILHVVVQEALVAA